MTPTDADVAILAAEDLIDKFDQYIDIEPAQAVRMRTDIAAALAKLEAPDAP